MVGDQTAEEVRRTLENGPFGLNRLASEAGLSYDVLRSWKSGRRRPSELGIRRLIAGLERKSEQLAQLAVSLRQVMDTDSDQDGGEIVTHTATG